MKNGESPAYIYDSVILLTLLAVCFVILLKEGKGLPAVLVKVEAGPAPSAADKGATALPFCRAIPRQRVEDNALYHAAKWEKL